LGLTYKAGTDTLRRSAAVELAVALSDKGARVRAFDPAVTALPADLVRQIALSPSVDDALRSADALVVATAWPVFRELAWDGLLPTMRDRTVIDPNWFLAEIFRGRQEISYAAVGLPWRHSRPDRT